MQNMIIYQVRLALWSTTMNFIVATIFVMLWCNMDIKGEASHNQHPNLTEHSHGHQSNEDGHVEFSQELSEHLSKDSNLHKVSKNETNNSPVLSYEELLRGVGTCLDFVKSYITLKAKQEQHTDSTEMNQEVNTNSEEKKKSDKEKSVLEPVVKNNENLTIAGIPTVSVPDAKDYKAKVEESQDEKTVAENVLPPEVDDNFEVEKQIPEKIEGGIEEEDENKEEIPLMQTDDIPSFDEWKKKMLQEQVQQEKSKVQEGQVNMNQNGDSNKKSNQNKINYASVTCGGKLQAANNEAQNPASILTENKDQYMIQPCKAKKWFVVELCEPVKIEVLELGNQELFSSLPESFIVSVSDRYPAKEWKILGTFKARDERKVQSFTIGDDMYAKYIRLEMLSHYGKEHYCPLSIIRVYGQDLHDDDNDGEENTHGSLPDDSSAEKNIQGEVKEEEPANLFNIAKDTVTSLVHSVLNGNGQNSGDGAVNDMVSLQNNSNNGTDNTTKSDKTTMEPCVPDVIVDNVASGSEALPPDKPEVPDAKTFPDNEQSSKPLVVLVERPYIPVSVFLDKCHFCDSRRYSYNDECLWKSTCAYLQLYRFIYPTCCIKKASSKTTENIQTGDSEKLNGNDVKKSLEVKQSEVKNGDKIADNEKDISNKVNRQEDLSKGTATSEERNKKKEEKHDGGKKRDQDDDKSSVISTKPSSTVDSEKKVEIKPTPKLDIPTDDKIVVTSNDKAENVDTITNSKSDGKILDNNIKPTESVKIEPTELPEGSRAHGPDLLHVRPSQNDSLSNKNISDQTKQSDGDKSSKQNISNSDNGENFDEKLDSTKDAIISETDTEKKVDNIEEVKQKDSNVDSSENSEITNSKVEATETEIEMSTTKDTEKSSKESDEKIIYAEASSDEKEQQQNVIPPVSNEGEVQVNRFIRSSQKETTYMKLKNKIRELEINLTLSSRYLEELSVKYKQRMEDMYKSLNKTIQKLTNTSKTAEIRDIRQQERISFLEKKVTNLTMYTSRLTKNLENVHSEVIERHLYILLIECIIFLAVMGWCLHTQKHHYRDRIRTVSNSYFNMATKTMNTSTPVKKHRRGLSFDLNKSITDQSFTAKGDGMNIEEIGPLKKSGSENDVTIVEPTFPPFVIPNIRKIDSKRKKKKKHSNNGAADSVEKSQKSTSLKRNSIPTSKTHTGISDMVLCNGRSEHKKAGTDNAKPNFSKKRVSSDPSLKKDDVSHSFKNDRETVYTNGFQNDEHSALFNGNGYHPKTSVIQNGFLDSDNDFSSLHNLKPKTSRSYHAIGSHENDVYEFSKLNKLQNTPTKSSSCLMCFSE